MGEAKRKRAAPCICGTGLPAEKCCWTSAGYHKKPQVLDLHNTGLTGSHNGCYMRATNGCDTKLSGEHLISEGVLGILADEQIEVSGLPWLKGKSKTLGFQALTARSLCTRHNSLLSPIDAAGADFFQALQSCGTTASGPGLRFLLSGHDIERWMLRSLAIFGVSRNLAIDGAVIDQQFIDRLRIIELLEGAALWTRPLGLYLLGGPGHQFTQRAHVQLAPLLRKGDGELIGITMNVQGLDLALLATNHDIAGTGLDRGFYRPGSVAFDMGYARHLMMLSWNDAHQHDGVTLAWQSATMVE